MSPQREKADAALKTVLSLLCSEDSAKTLAAATRHKIQSDAPSAKWSLANRLLMMQAGTTDARGFKQWKKAGRHVVKGGQHFKILGPRMVEDEDGAEGDTKCIGFCAIRVFALSETDGEPIPSLDPNELPALSEAAERMGYEVSYNDTAGSYGYAQHNPGGGGIIVLGSHDPDVYWHELAHAAHRSFEPKKQGGQEDDAEVVAETVAAVLAELYGSGATGTHVEYILSYCAGEPRKATRLVKTIERVLDQILIDEDEAAA